MSQSRFHPFTPICAAYGIGIGSILLAVLVLLWADLKQKKTDPLELAAQAGEFLDSAGTEFRKKGRLAEAADVYRKAADVWGSLGNLENQISSLNRRGNILLNSGKDAEAETQYREALNVALLAGSQTGRVDCLLNIALLLQFRGDYVNARETFEEVLEIAAETRGLENSTVTALRFLAELGNIQGDLAESRRLLSRAKTIQVDHSLPGSLLDADLAWLDILEGHNTRAAQRLEELLTSDELPASTVGRNVHRLGEAMVNLGRYEEARRVYRHSLQLARTGGWAGADLGVLSSLCRLAIEHPEPNPEAGDRDCRELADSMEEGDPNRQVSASHWLAEYHYRGGRLEQAIAIGNGVIGNMETLYQRIQGRNHRARFLEDRSAFFRRQIDFAMEADASRPGAGYDVRGLALSESLRARSLLSLWAEGGVDLLQSADPTLHQHLEKKIDEMYRLESERREVSTDQEIDALQAEIDLLDERLRASSADYRQVAEAPFFDLKALQQKLDSRTAFVELLLSKTQSHLFVIQKESFRSYQLPPGAELDAAAKNYLRLLSNPGKVSNISALWHEGYKLTRLLWGENEEILASLPERIVFIGDEALQQFPLAALPRRNSSPRAPRYLIDDFEIVYLPALSLLTSSRSSKTPVSRPRPALLLADPVYRLAGPRDLRLEAASEMQLERYFPKGRPRVGVGLLPFAAAEADRIVARFGGRPLKVKRGPEASKALILSSDMSAFSIVHLTSHGYQDPSQYELSALMLSEIDERGNEIDGKLRLQDLYRVRLDADLVVASACQTGVGGEFRLEGTTGLAQGFFHAGARRAMVSQWRVESESTAHLMDHFYRYLHAGEPPGAALRLASLALRAEARQLGTLWDSPYYWAPFVMIGDWHAFELPVGNLH